MSTKTKTASVKAHDPKAQSFLGREFLTWLWFRCEMDGGTFDIPGADPKKPDEVGVVFNDYVSLISDGEEREESILKKGSPHRSAEARTALVVGKLVASAKLEVARGDRTWSVTISGETLDLKGVKYPEAKAEDAEERTLERLDAMQEIGEIVDALYTLFISVRVSPDWEAKEVPAIVRWIKSRGREE